VNAVYRVPREALRTPGDLPSKHVYCGLTPNGDYTGTRQPFEHNGQTHYGCKAFDSSSEMDRIRTEEVDYQAIKRNQNVHENAPPWERLVLCAESDKIQFDGRSVCKHTTHALRLDSGRVSETSNERATKTCANLGCESNCTPGVCVRDPQNRCTAVVDHKATLLPSTQQPVIPLFEPDDINSQFFDRLRSS